jgi:HSP20 family molecular chaperone IbpA
MLATLGGLAIGLFSTTTNLFAQPQSTTPAPMQEPRAIADWRANQPRMRQEKTEDAYLLIVDLNGLPPENLQVRPFGQALLVRMRQEARSRRSETYNDGQGYRQSYRVSSGSRTRRLPVPPDGDLATMTRDDSAEQVRIEIPRRVAPTGR